MGSADGPLGNAVFATPVSPVMGITPKSNARFVRTSVIVPDPRLPPEIGGGVGNKPTKVVNSLHSENEQTGLPINIVSVKSSSSVQSSVISFHNRFPTGELHPNRNMGPPKASISTPALKCITN